MSGEKRTYITIEEQQRRKIREQENKLSIISRDLPERLNAIRRQMGNEMQNRIAPLQARQQQQENKISGLKSDLGNLEKKTQERLRRQQDDFIGRLKEQRGEYKKLFKEQDHKFTNMVQEERIHRQKAVDNLQGQISSIVADANRKQSYAKAFVADLSEIMNDTDELPHQRFATGQFDTIRRDADDARRNVETGMPEAALSTAQKAYWDVTDLRILVLQKEKEFMLIHQAALQEAKSLLEEARANRKYQLEVNEEEGRTKHELEVDHWTHGELSALEQEIKTYESQLIHQEKTLTIDETKKILAKIEALKPRINEIVDHAKDNILSSQLRFEIAGMTAEAFQGQGFTVDDATYAGDDERNDYVVKVKNISGDEVVTIISPVEGRLGENRISIHSYDESFVDEGTIRQRVNEITDILNEEGMLTTPAECNGGAKPEYQNIEAVRNSKVKRRTSSI